MPDTILIETLALKAMLYDADGDRCGALAELARAIKLARPSRCVQPFLNAGPWMAAFLERLGRQKRFERYIGKILGRHRRGRSADASEEPRDLAPTPGVPTPAPPRPLR